MVLGLRGNAKLLLGSARSQVRRGILLHTGTMAWLEAVAENAQQRRMHAAHPNAIKSVWKTLVGMGVAVRNNTGGVLPYKPKPQGLCVVYNVD